MNLSIVIPAKNESSTIGGLVFAIREIYPSIEVIVVNDGSSDETAEVAAAAGAKVISHPYSKGNGAAIKSGARAASGDVLVFMDADGQHGIADIKLLLAKLSEGYDMVVGARASVSQANYKRAVGNFVYNWLASKLVGHKILDLTSGFRAIKKNLFLQFLYLLPNGFSYPTTITMAFFRAGYSVAYIPIVVSRRAGQSHINLFRDGAKFFLIIFKVGTLYSPLKIFLPISLILSFFGISLYAYNFFMHSRLTNMSVILLLGATIVFLIGLISEQITALMYAKQNN